MHLDVISFCIISIGSYTGHNKSLQSLEASLEVFCDTDLSNAVAFYIISTFLILYLVDRASLYNPFQIKPTRRTKLTSKFPS